MYGGNLDVRRTEYDVPISFQHNTVNNFMHRVHRLLWLPNTNDKKAIRRFEWLEVVRREEKGTKT